jgi:hypothetical protein
MFRVHISQTGTYDPLTDEIQYSDFRVRVEVYTTPGTYAQVGECDGDGDRCVVEDEAIAIVRHAIYGDPKGPPAGWVRANKRSLK